MTRKQSSSRASSIAAHYTGVTSRVLLQWFAQSPEQIAKEIRTLAASVLAQDEIAKPKKVKRGKRQD